MGVERGASWTGHEDAMGVAFVRRGGGKQFGELLGGVDHEGALDAFDEDLGETRRIGRLGSLCSSAGRMCPQT